MHFKDPITGETVRRFPDSPELLPPQFRRVEHDMTREKLSADLKINLIMSCIKIELERAMKKHPAPFHSSHEAYGIIAEEVHEFFLEVIANDLPRQTKEAIQIAAMAARFVYHLGEIKDGSE